MLLSDEPMPAASADNYESEVVSAPADPPEEPLATNTGKRKATTSTPKKKKTKERKKDNIPPPNPPLFTEQPPPIGPFPPAEASSSRVYSAEEMDAIRIMLTQ